MAADLNSKNFIALGTLDNYLFWKLDTVSLKNSRDCRRDLTELCDPVGIN